MSCEQTRIDVEPTKRGRKMNYTIWQPETTCKPWAVHVEGYKESTIDITLYHDDLNRFGRVYYGKIHAPTAKKFVDFLTKQLQLWASFARCNLEYRTCDAIALYDAYSAGVSSSHVLDSKSLLERNYHGRK